MRPGQPARSPAALAAACGLVVLSATAPVASEPLSRVASPISARSAASEASAPAAWKPTPSRWMTRAQREQVAALMGEDALPAVDRMIEQLHRQRLRTTPQAAAAPRPGAPTPGRSGAPRMHKMSYAPDTAAEPVEDAPAETEGDAAGEAEEAPIQVADDGSMQVEHVVAGVLVRGRARHERWQRNGRAGADYVLTTDVEKTLDSGQRAILKTVLRERTEFDHCPRPGGIAAGHTEARQEVDVRLVPGNLRIASEGSQRTDYAGQVDDAAELERVQASVQIHALVTSSAQGQVISGTGSWPVRGTLTPVLHEFAPRDDPQDFRYLTSDLPRRLPAEGAQLQLRTEEARQSVNEVGINGLSAALNSLTRDEVIRTARSLWRSGACIELTAVEGGSRVARPGETVALKVRSSHKLGQPQAEQLPIEASGRRLRWEGAPVQPATAQWTMQVLEPEASAFLKSVSNRGIGSLIVDYGLTRRLRITIEGRRYELQDSEFPCIVREVYEGELKPLGADPQRVGGRWTLRHQNFMCVDVVIEVDGQRDERACFGRGHVEFDAVGRVQGRDPDATLALMLRFRPESMTMDGNCQMDEFVREAMRMADAMPLPVVRLPVAGKGIVRQPVPEADGLIKVEWVR